jgi:hypothetical protein
MTGVTVQLVPPLSDALQAKASARGLTLTAFVNVALNAYLEVSKNPNGRMSDSEFKATTWRAPWCNNRE